jgi:Peptidase A4 family
MLSKILGYLLLLTVLPVFAQTTARASDTEGIFAPRQHAPRKRFKPAPEFKVGGVTVSESINWSGYAVTGSGFTNAKGSWIVPAVNCSQTPNTYSSFWVGIDGWTSSTVEQTGTDSDCSGTTPNYYVWYEFYPKFAYLVPSVPVSPGDKMSASVDFDGSAFTVSITNETTGLSFSKTERVGRAQRSSAEWIAEAPCCTNGGGILPLSDFGTVDFGQKYTRITNTNFAADSSTSGFIGAFGSAVNESIMVDANTGALEAMPSSLSSDGSSFTDKWASE